MGKCLTPQLTQSTSSPQTEGFSFSTMENAMQFTTHNNEAIPTMGLSKVGTVETTRRELTKLFGEPIGYNFVVKFSDGERVLVYPLKGDTYQVEGTSKNALNNLSIAIDLHRERGEDRKSTRLNSSHT